MTKTHSQKLVREGRFVAEVDVELLHDEGSWSPYLSMDEALKLDKVRAALRAGDVKSASKLARVFSLTPIAV
jgi:hypothetical protein